jgi:hypothetical protein
VGQQGGPGPVWMFLSQLLYERSGRKEEGKEEERDGEKGG